MTNDECRMKEFYLFDIMSFIVIPAQAGIQKDYIIGLFTGSSRLEVQGIRRTA
ncbi:MAG: hypothetical protein JSW26_23245 [Desulfobacterales bacterium]|nr:MAG: hypothetical protein JSW26_23245 [Desulfobacterales bacterium]